MNEPIDDLPPIGPLGTALLRLWTSRLAILLCLFWSAVLIGVCALGAAALVWALATWALRSTGWA